MRAILSDPADVASGSVKLAGHGCGSQGSPLSGCVSRRSRVGPVLRIVPRRIFRAEPHLRLLVGPARVRRPPAGLERRGERELALAFDPGCLDERRQVEREGLIAQIDHDLFWIEDAVWHLRNPIYYAGTLDPALYLTREYAPLADRMRAYVAY